MPLLSEIVDEFMADLSTPRTRYPVVRTGERDPIPSVVRLSVYLRDGFHCRECGTGGDESLLELDHMLPWSAGGGDHSGNLRTLCMHCNQARSNWNDGGHVPNVRPTTWWCWDCWRHPEMDPPESPCDPPDVIVRGRRATWRTAVDLTAAPYVTASTEQVYCAWCRGYGWSNVWFSPSQQDHLARIVNDPTCHDCPSETPKESK